MSKNRIFAVKTRCYGLICMHDGRVDSTYASKIRTCAQTQNHAEHRFKFVTAANADIARCNAIFGNFEPDIDIYLRSPVVLTLSRCGHRLDLRDSLVKWIIKIKNPRLL